MSSAASLCEIRRLLPGDILKVAGSMRQADQWEIWHGSRRGAYESLLRSVDASFLVRVITRGGNPVAIFGLVHLDPGVCPWMLGTDDLSRCTSLLRECRALVDSWEATYGYLGNAVWAGNTVHIRWLKWLGFTFDGSDLRNGETFLHFHRKHHV